MARYRKIDSRIWNDEKFRSMSDRGKLVFLLLLTHPHMTAIGGMRASQEGLAAEMGWSTKAFREAFGEALAKGMAKHHEKASLVWLPNFLKYNPPESPNVVKAWSSALDLLPECTLKTQAIQEAKDYAEGLTEGFRKALPEAFAKGMPYPEQEQEQEQEQEREAPAPPRRASKRCPSEFEVTAQMREWAATNCPEVDIDAETETFREFEFARAYTDWPATWRRWMKRAKPKANGTQRTATIESWEYS